MSQDDVWFSLQSAGVKVFYLYTGFSLTGMRIAIIWHAQRTRFFHSVEISILKCEIKKLHF